jgi:hydroxymethylbilane synthase
VSEAWLAVSRSRRIYNNFMVPLRIGTRGSQLALWQANHVRDRLRALDPNRPIELVEIETEGDLIRDVPLVALGGQGAFTKAIQQALLDGRADVAVHSLKDLPTFTVAGLMLAAVPERGPTGDVFVSKKHRSFADLPQGAVVATSSLRRRAQVLHRRPDLKLVDMRGNVETRLRKLIDQELDAIILAEAGLVRLGLADRITEVLDRSWMLPAVGQGALGLECRIDDSATRQLVERLNHAETHAAVLAERAMLRGLGGGCSVPIGAAISGREGLLTLRGVVLSPDGSQRIEAEGAERWSQPEQLGDQLAKDLTARGAQRILDGGTVVN